jgi:predicted oxidoreductase (fatty acid repression mutant protein)
MSNIAASFIEGMKGRRSIYALTNESTISDDRIEEIISEVVKHTPSPFNSQTARLVVLLKEEHEKLWDLALEIATATVPPQVLENLYKPRIAGFRAGYGTVSLQNSHWACAIMC